VTEQLKKVQHLTLTEPTARFMAAAIGFITAYSMHQALAVSHAMRFIDQERDYFDTNKDEINAFILAFKLSAEKAWGFQFAETPVGQSPLADILTAIQNAIGPAAMVMQPGMPCPHCAHGSGERCCFCGEVIP
jgi:hypothetical protein